MVCARVGGPDAPAIPQLVSASLLFNHLLNSMSYTTQLGETSQTVGVYPGSSIHAVLVGLFPAVSSRIDISSLTQVMYVKALG